MAVAATRQRLGGQFEIASRVRSLEPDEIQPAVEGGGHTFDGFTRHADGGFGTCREATTISDYPAARTQRIREPPPPGNHRRVAHSAPLSRGGATTWDELSNPPSVRWRLMSRSPIPTTLVHRGAADAQGVCQSVRRNGRGCFHDNHQRTMRARAVCSLPGWPSSRTG